MFIILKNCELVECHTLLELGSHFDIKITDTGRVYLDGKLDTISYNMEKYSHQEAYLDFIRYRLHNFKVIYSAKKLT